NSEHNVFVTGDLTEPADLRGDMLDVEVPVASLGLRAAERLLDGVAVGRRINDEQAILLVERQRRIDVNPHAALQPHPALLLAKRAAALKGRQQAMLVAETCRRSDSDGKEGEDSTVHHHADECCDSKDKRGPSVDNSLAHRPARLQDRGSKRPDKATALSNR